MRTETETMAETSCIFCRILRGELTPSVLAYRDEWTAVFPSRIQQPPNRGHMLVLPVRHVAHIYEVGVDLAGPMMATLSRVTAAVKKVCAADGVSIRQNNEEAAGQDVLHLHFHVIPRFADDGFTGLDRSRGAVEVPVEQRVQQAQNLAEGLRRLQ
jgi:histidine triad (HIT) family protein